MADASEGRSKDHVPGAAREMQEGEAHMERANVAQEVPAEGEAGAAIVSVTLPGDLKDRLDRVVEADPDLDASAVVRSALERYLSGD